MYVPASVISISKVPNFPISVLEISQSPISGGSKCATGMDGRAESESEVKTCLGGQPGAKHEKNDVQSESSSLRLLINIFEKCIFLQP